MTKARLIIDMPKSCRACRFRTTQEAVLGRPNTLSVCTAAQGRTSMELDITTVVDTGDSVSPDCPLQEVKTCKWVDIVSVGFWQTSCGESFSEMFKFGKFCTFCGNEIEVGGE